MKKNPLLLHRNHHHHLNLRSNYLSKLIYIENHPKKRNHLPFVSITVCRDVSRSLFHHLQATTNLLPEAHHAITTIAHQSSSHTCLTDVSPSIPTGHTFTPTKLQALFWFVEYDKFSVSNMFNLIYSDIILKKWVNKLNP